jgi:tetraacyldisaccharide 4'-kinase
VSVGDLVRDRVWLRRGVGGQLGYLALRPLSALFGLGVGVRGLGYRVGVLRARRAPIPVVSVGNLAVGGTGKTPVTLWLGQMLAAHGARPAIVSRGYGGTARGVTVVSRGDGPEVGPELVGDEPVMMAKSFAGPVITAARRIDAARTAAGLGCDVVVLDDGFQHRAVARAFDLVLVDARRGPLLPAGPLREPLAALRRADALLLVERDAGDGAAPPLELARPAFRMRLDAVGLVESVERRWRARPLVDIANRRVVAVAGVARPEAFYAMLRRWEATIAEVFEYPDHHRYTIEDWHRIARGGHSADLIVTTEKDLVKLEAFPFATGKLVALRIAPQVERADELIAVILAAIGRQGHPGKENHEHGHQ